MKKLAWLVGILSAFSSATAAAVTIDFDALAAGNYTEAQFNAMFGATFDNTTAGSFDVSGVVNNPLNPAFSAPNAVLNGNSSNAANTTRVTFDSLVSFVSVTMGDFNADADELHLVAYDSANAVIGSAAFSNPASSEDGHVLSVSVPGIKSIEFWGDGLSDANNVYWDNLTWEDGQQIPEPATLMLLGLALAGLYARKRNLG